MNAMRTVAVCMASIVALLASETLGKTESRDWTFIPEYRLPGNAAATIGPRPAQAAERLGVIDQRPMPMVFHGQEPSDRISDLVRSSELPRGDFTFTFELVDHVNQPIGMMLAGRHGDGLAWAVSYYHGEIRLDTPSATVSTQVRRQGFKRYWHHVALVRQGDELSLIVDGAKVGSVDEHSSPTWIEINAYTEHEPYMQLGNLVPRASLHEHALGLDQIRSEMARMHEAIERGWVFPGVFHFNAGPYLNSPQPTSMAVLWGTDRPARARIEYGTTIPMGSTVELDDPSDIQEVVLDGLEPATAYYYRVVAIDQSGNEVDSGTLTFRTAGRPGDAVRFAIIGDTESRPHINDQISKLVWDHRPEFVINVGDLTDGGKEDRQFQWTHEYFLGMTQLHSRVPAVPVAGNGEGDLYWYNRYHVLPAPEGYYRLVYGDIELFMLDSNRRGADFAPGGTQREWLEAALDDSDAKWKIAAHHHAVYSSDENDYGNTWAGEATTLGDPRVQPLVEAYEQGGVDMVLYGHLHTYERTLPVRDGRIDTARGVTYIQAGGAGGNLEDFTPTRNWFSGTTHRGHHFLIVTAAGDEMQVKVYDIEGDLRDTFTINAADRSAGGQRLSEAGTASQKGSE